MKLIFQLDVLPNVSGKQVSFSLQNDQAEVQRFEFPEHDDFTFVPSMGHIQPEKVWKLWQNSFQPAFGPSMKSRR